MPRGPDHRACAASDEAICGQEERGTQPAAQEVQRVAAMDRLHRIKNLRGLYGSRRAVLDAELYVDLLQVLVHRPRR